MTPEFAEEWRPVSITEFSHLYEVSNTGRVRSLDRNDQAMVGVGLRVKWSRNFKGREMRCKPNTRGYPQVYLRNAPTFRNVVVHRLVAMAFIANPDNLPEVNHIDTIKTNNVWTNLEWISRVGNHNHAVDAGIMSVANRKLSDDDIATIILRYNSGCSQGKLAAQYGVVQGTISRIVNGVRRAHQR